MSAASGHHAQPEQDIPSDMTIRTLRWGRSTSSSEAVSAKASTGPHHGAGSDSTAAARTGNRRPKPWKLYADWPSGGRKTLSYATEKQRAKAIPRYERLGYKVTVPL